MRGSQFTTLDAELYHAILMSYMTGDNIGLQTSLENAKKAAKEDSKYQPIVHLGELRLLIRNGKLQIADVNKYNLLIPSITSTWYGEFNFVLSNATATLNLHELSLNYSLAAAKGLKEFGAKKKAVRALMNSMASESCIRPEKHYISELLYIYQEAKASSDSISIGTTLINLSREYQKLGLFNIAMKYANRSIAVFTKHNPGGIDYALALTHRSYLYCEIGVYREARLDIETALFSAFSEVQSAIKIMSDKFPELQCTLKKSLNQESLNQSPNPSWSERKTEELTPHSTKLEGKLIDILIKKPQTKSELCQLLYGDRIDITAKENRLGNLLNRVRKRHPNLIILKENKYYLSELPYYPNISKTLK